MCVLMGFLCVWDQISAVLGHNRLLEKKFSCLPRNRMLDKIFRQSRFFHLFSTAFFFDIISSMSPQVFESTFSTDSWWYFKELCFRKDIHLVFSITCRTPVKDAGFI